MLDFSITDFITTISTVALVSIAYQANDTWKRELREKKHIKIVRDILYQYIGLEHWFEYWGFEEDSSEIWKQGVRTLKYIEQLLYEFKLINGSDEIIQDAEYFINLIKEYVYNQRKFADMTKFKEDFRKEEKTKIFNEVLENIEKAKKHCEEAVKDFYKL